MYARLSACMSAYEFLPTADTPASLYACSLIFLAGIEIDVTSNNIRLRTDLNTESRTYLGC